MRISSSNEIRIFLSTYYTCVFIPNFRPKTKKSSAAQRARKQKKNYAQSLLINNATPSEVQTDVTDANNVSYVEPQSSHSRYLKFIANETPSQKSKRLEKMKERYASLNPDEKAAILENTKERHTNLTESERADRLDKMKERYASLNPGDKAAMLENIKERHANLTESERADKLDKMKERYASLNPGDKAAMLENIKERHANLTESERADKLCKMKKRYANLAPTEREETINKNLKRMHETLSSETSLNRENRLQQNKERKARSRQNERNRKNDTSIHHNQHDFIYPKQIYDYHKDLYKLKIETCNICNEKWPIYGQIRQEDRCDRCKREKNPPFLYSDDNDMDPGVQPDELKGLTQAEELLISGVIPIISVHKLPYGQMGYKGHVINFPQEVSEVAEILPRLPNDLKLLIFKKKIKQEYTKILLYDAHMLKRLYVG